MNMSMKSLVVTMVLMISIINFSEAQTTTVASCAQSLIPCADYLNSTNPPSSCCDPLKETVATQLKCLCDLFNTPGLLESFKVNVTQALGLSRLCGIKSDLSSCSAGSAPSPSSSSIPPPATRGGDSGAGKVAFSGFSFLLLFWASMLFN
ncbi:putative bifunctional inhibitor/plant lipid transfer protein/seed storage helical [Lupinus albus]|uniref:Putative bifunctional inhibitor/plant lipid transfer protein/seed storage helical n=1 Tax=Lupinus albus TaxID=3870 RepID=A0A6A4NYV1_LUPAL|nr:putative bifunctional inhibitor/plant lipid transfer protein/seed storage helical [Lupinus albus]